MTVGLSLILENPSPVYIQGRLHEKRDTMSVQNEDFVQEVLANWPEDAEALPPSVRYLRKKGHIYVTLL